MKCNLLLLSAFMDRELDEARTAEVSAHLVGCAHCRTAMEQLSVEASGIANLPRVSIPDEQAHALLCDVGLLQRHEPLPERPASKAAQRTNPETLPWLSEAPPRGALPWDPCRPVTSSTGAAQSQSGATGPTGATWPGPADPGSEAVHDGPDTVDVTGIAQSRIYEQPSSTAGGVAPPPVVEGQTGRDDVSAGMDAGQEGLLFSQGGAATEAGSAELLLEAADTASGDSSPAVFFTHGPASDDPAGEEQPAAPAGLEQPLPVSERDSGAAFADPSLWARSFEPEAPYAGQGHELPREDIQQAAGPVLSAFGQPPVRAEQPSPWRSVGKNVRTLLEQLKPRIAARLGKGGAPGDGVEIVVGAGASEVVHPSTRHGRHAELVRSGRSARARISSFVDSHSMGRGSYPGHRASLAPSYESEQEPAPLRPQAPLLPPRRKPSSMRQSELQRIAEVAAYMGRDLLAIAMLISVATRSMIEALPLPDGLARPARSWVGPAACAAVVFMLVLAAVIGGHGGAPAAAPLTHIAGAASHKAAPSALPSAHAASPSAHASALVSIASPPPRAG